MVTNTPLDYIIYNGVVNFVVIVQYLRNGWSFGLVIIYTSIPLSNHRKKAKTGGSTSTTTTTTMIVRLEQNTLLRYVSDSDE